MTLHQMIRLCLTIACAMAPVAGGAAETVDYSRRINPSPGAVPEYAVPYVVPTTNEVKAIVDRVGHYVIQNTSLHVFDNKAGAEIKTPDLAHPNPDAVVDRRFTPFNTWDYPNGVTWSAFNRITEITGDKTYLEHTIRVYDFVFIWMPYFRELEKQTGKQNEFSKMVNMAALDHCGAISAGLIRTQLSSPDPRFRAWIDVVADYISKGQFRLPDGTLARERPQAVSLWTDDFYMGISFLAQMGRLTGERKYWDDAVRQVVQGSARLFDEAKGLYDHGWSENTDGYDPRFYWARANGWAALAMTELLADLPADHPGRDRVLQYYRQLMRSVVEQQDGTGLWHNVLDRHETYLETSASAMFVYALARGVNEGWLSPIYGPAAITGWNGVTTRVLPDGRVDSICEGTTYANDHTYYAYRGASADTIFVGPVLYAGVEVIRLIQNPKIQIAAPKPNAVNSALHMKAQK
jgi:unsaturated rhamnogalacturonyl hydrolase